MSRERPGDRPEGCPDEGALLAFLDGALPEGEAREVGEHVEGCRECRERAAEVEARNAAVRSWLGKHDPPPPPREAYDLSARSRGRAGPRRLRARGRRARHWAGAAAAVVLLVAALSGPVRAWVANVVRGLIGADPVVETAPPAEAPPTHGVSFLAEGDELQVVFESPRTRGLLIVEASPGPLVTIRVPDDAVAILVRPGRVEVGNAGLPSGTYHLAVAPGVERIRILVPGAEPIVVEVARLEEGPLHLELP